MEYIKVTDLKEILKDISLSNNDLGRHGDGFEQAMHLINKRLEAINYTPCCKSDSEQLPKRLSNEAYTMARGTDHKTFTKWWDMQKV